MLCSSVTGAAASCAGPWSCLFDFCDYVSAGLNSSKFFVCQGCVSTNCFALRTALLMFSSTEIPWTALISMRCLLVTGKAAFLMFGVLFWHASFQCSLWTASLSSLWPKLPLVTNNGWGSKCFLLLFTIPLSSFSSDLSCKRLRTSTGYSCPRLSRFCASRMCLRVFMAPLETSWMQVSSVRWSSLC